MSNKGVSTAVSCLLLLAGCIVFLAAGWAGGLVDEAVAQDETAVITVPEPGLTETGKPFPSGWLAIVGKSQYTIYLTANSDAEAAAETAVSGQWQPEIPVAGLYRVEVYVGVSEFREYALLFPQRLSGFDQLTHSARYVVTHDGGETPVAVDLDLRGSGWLDLGVYEFAVGAGSGVTLSNQTNEAGGTAVVPFSAARFTREESPPATPPAATETPQPTNTPEPTKSALPLSLAFGAPEPPLLPATGGPNQEEVEIPFSLGGQVVGRMTISYPAELEENQADNINANILVTENFTHTLALALEDLTTNELIGDMIVSSQFFLTLDAAAFDFDETFKTQKLTAVLGQPTGAAWNIKPKTGVRGVQDFNIKVILSFTDGIPEVSGPPPTFSIEVLGQAAAPTLTPMSPAPAPTSAPTPTPPSAVRRIFNNLIDNTAVLIGGCLSFIAAIAAIYFNYRQNKAKATVPPPDAPAILDTERQVQLHRWLDDYFDEQELRSLCLEMGVDYDDLRFSGQSNKARELVGWCARNGRLDNLAAKIQELRPNLPD